MWILFSELSDPIGPGGWIAIVLAGFTTCSTAILALLNGRHKARLERESTAISQWAEFADRQEKQIRQQEIKLDQLMDEAARARLAETYCRRDLAEQRAALLILYGFCKSLHHSATEAGLKVPPLPPEPSPTPPRPDVEDVRLVQRKNEHEIGLMKAAAREAADQKKPPPASQE